MIDIIGIAGHYKVIAIRVQLCCVCLPYLSFKRQHVVPVFLPLFPFSRLSIAPDEYIASLLCYTSFAPIFCFQFSFLVSAHVVVAASFPPPSYTLIHSYHAYNVNILDSNTAVSLRLVCKLIIGSILIEIL